jgi:hypothetical protein
MQAVLIKFSARFDYFSARFDLYNTALYNRRNICAPISPLKSSNAFGRVCKLNLHIHSQKFRDIETKIVYLVKGHPTHFQLQYDGTWGTGLSVAKINYYGNQSGLWIDF